jgi:hypothetical protein
MQIFDRSTIVVILTHSHKIAFNPLRNRLTNVVLFFITTRVSNVNLPGGHLKTCETTSIKYNTYGTSHERLELNNLQHLVTYLLHRRRNIKVERRNHIQVDS